jgi:heme-degrading monooxygenase HmoA
MHARLVHFQITPGQLDEFVQIHQTSVLPTLRQEPGFKGFLLLTDSSQHTAHILTFWETEAHMRSLDPTRGAFRDRLATHAHLNAAPPVFEHTEVRIQE